MHPSLLKIGELAARSGLTVRTLHHYDHIGLLTPSARAPSGYRLYGSADVARLQQIQALRGFGMALADIATLLDSPEAPFADVVAQQIAALDQQIEQAGVLRARLALLAQQMHGAGQPAMEDWLATLEQMQLYERYFTPAQLASLPAWQHDARRRAAWQSLVEQVRALMARTVAPESTEAGALALRWMSMLEQDTAADADIAARLDAMTGQEIAVQRHTGITPALRQFVSAAFSAQRTALYARYLDAGEMQRMQDTEGRHDDAWVALIAAVQRHMASGAAPHDERSQALAREWMRLFQLRAGSDPATQAKIRQAHASEPALLTGTWVSEAMLEFIRKAAALAGVGARAAEA